MKEVHVNAPHAIIMVGIPGAGKTTFAAHFAETFKAPFIDQTELTTKNGLTHDTGAKITEMLLIELMKTGKTLLYEGATETKKQRAQLAQGFVKAGYQPLFVWVQTDTRLAKPRALKPYPKGSGMTKDAFETALKRFEPLGEKEECLVISGHQNYTTQLKIVLKQLSQNDTATTPPQRRAASSR